MSEVIQPVTISKKERRALRKVQEQQEVFGAQRRALIRNLVVGGAATLVLGPTIWFNSNQSNKKPQHLESSETRIRKLEDPIKPRTFKEFSEASSDYKDLAIEIFCKSMSDDYGLIYDPDHLRSRVLLHNQNDFPSEIIKDTGCSNFTFPPNSEGITSPGWQNIHIDTTRLYNSFSGQTNSYKALISDILHELLHYTPRENQADEDNRELLLSLFWNL